MSVEPKVTVKVAEEIESALKGADCRGTIVGPGVNQPAPFLGYAGFVGWESPIRLRNGTWLVGFNAGYGHASPSRVSFWRFPPLLRAQASLALGVVRCLTRAPLHRAALEALMMERSLLGKRLDISGG